MTGTFTGGITFTGGGFTLVAAPAGVKAIFGFGYNSSIPAYYSLTNLVSNTGVVSTDTAGVGTARNDLAAASYG